MSRRRSASEPPRPPLTLRDGALSRRERDRRADAYARFVSFAGARLHAADAASTVVDLVIEFGQDCYDQDAPMYWFRQLILAMQDRCSRWAPDLKRAWRALTAWEAVEPSCPHYPLPQEIWKAMVTLAIMLEHPRAAAVLLLGFLGMMRPGEVLRLRRCDVSLPGDRLEDDGCVFVAIWTHKTRSRGAGAQHAKIADPLAVNWLGRLLAVLNLPDDAQVYPASPQSFRRVWDFLLAVLKVTSRSGCGFTPVSLRAGGATAAYPALGVPEVRWRLRHASEASATRYIQEAGAAFASCRLSSEAKQRVRVFAPGVEVVLRCLPTPGPSGTSRPPFPHWA